MKPPLLFAAFISFLPILFISSCEQNTATQGKIDDTTLDSYSIISNEILRTNKMLDKKNEATLGIMEQKMVANRAATKPFYDRVILVDHWSHQLCSYIDTIKAVLISKTLKIPKTEADTLRVSQLGLDENADEPERIMLENAPVYLGQDGAAYPLKSKLREYRKCIIKLIKPEDTTALYIGLKTPDTFKEVEQGNWKKETWEYEHFHNRPLIPTIILLSKLQNDIKEAESTIINQELIYAVTPDSLSKPKS